MKRIPETELMDQAEQADAYAAADFSEPNTLFVDHFLHRFAGASPARLLDLGCGPGDIAIRLAQRFPQCHVTGVDGAEAMLVHAREASQRSGLCERIVFIHGRIQAMASDVAFDAIVSNSLLHHLQDPMDLWRTIGRLAAPGAGIMVMDLVRPDTEEALQALVDIHMDREPDILRRDFTQSLRAAFTVDEVRNQLVAADFAGFEAETISDRHLVVYGCMSS